MRDIQRLLPHRPPFLLVDEILSAEKEAIIGIKKFDDSVKTLGKYFSEQETVPGLLLLESMGQCGGAGLRLLSEADGASDAVYGFVALEHVSFHNRVEYGNTVKMVIKNHLISKRLVKQSGTCYCDEEIIAEAIWFFAKLESEFKA